jgi:predicted O-methyltransferase YrrM
VTLPVISKATLNYVWPINWCGLHRQYLGDGEMEIIAALLREVEAKSVVEIGCRDGRTARVLLHNVSALQHYIGVDVPMEYEPALDHQRSEMVASPGDLAASDPRFDLIIRERGSLDLGPQDLPQVDAVFIDGDHSERVVAHDSALARAITKPDGVIVWHDAFNGAVEVMRVLDRLCDEGWPIKVVEGTWLAFRLT